MQALTDRQQQVLNFVAEFIRQHNFPPTLREISAELRTSGTVSALRHLEALERKGHIVREAGSSRGISLAQQSCRDFVDLPIVGVVHAGMPALAFEEVEGYYPVERSQARGGTFFLRVKGDSMIEDAILEGDLALVRPQATADNGDVVVAMIDSEATLKRFYREKDHIRLQPRNPTMKPIIVGPDEEVIVIGKVVKVVREVE